MAIDLGSNNDTLQRVLWSTRLPGRIESSACVSRCGQFVVVGMYQVCGNDTG
jgi:hypothetical protein